MKTEAQRSPKPVIESLVGLYFLSYILELGLIDHLAAGAPHDSTLSYNILLK